MTNDELRLATKKDLVEQARAAGISGWHAMRKDELIEALLEVGRKKARPARSEKTADKVPATDSKHSPKPTVAAKPRAQKAAARDTSSESLLPDSQDSTKFPSSSPSRDLSAKVSKNLPASYGKDRIVVMVRDPYWLHAYWELTHAIIQRAEAALGQDWHGSKPVLRLFDISSNDTTSISEAHVRDIEIHGGCNNWYIEVSQPPRSYRVDIGYLARNGRFFVLSRSNTVTTPRAGATDAIDDNWSDIDAKAAERIYAMSSGYDPTASSLELKQLFEERLRRPMGSSAISSFGSGAFSGVGGKTRKFWFQLDAELIVYGATEPTASVTLQGEPVKLRPDGTFTMRFRLPDSRQIIPATATSADGIEERTIVLAVERNTKHLEPMIHDLNEG
ncbi:DUF4912 domain-containing protein [Tuwongella immobilis]|uniref:Rho termination factor-like N-terminal domain-containing protein n=1 Tax=Tuwongella immobilis TaxID=692036 RepID=A0A6C2YQ71_9BACT|nr:DUF4912 domain-containing protein [Tuwongella immobilis]VIP03461.1 protein containing rho termination factor : Uncharacterized protein OS=Singulisphaera acidiphila (strain ATCC BAA-1392 / DSM 18658 / VKM B-2454 / MOB10) GN=Sinac_6872 PE=4 SV=1: Rho_N [Tuwongella immobilis]VTS04294.1 protein containing rho termination factor : Uncharacterized protein OS=Singulisphaera acidiphila (strain ATCC BAA-1392 / DSM 18658 / VKM B-2454 / MOB10) GN=Sinac_6872 PE=4 SV=1: Rho_N [Tuwongella immobilis]